MELVVCPQCFLQRHIFIGCYDIQHNDTQHKVTLNDTQNNWTLGVTMLCIMLSVVILNVTFYLLLC